MDDESELNLYNHIDPFSSAPGPSEKVNKSKNAIAKNHQKKANLQRSPNKNKQQFKKNQGQQHPQRIENKLSAAELLFFPKNHVVTPIDSAPTCPIDSNRKKNYMEQICKMTPDERRKLRGKRDARYLHQNANKQLETDPTVVNDLKHEICVDHMIGKCRMNAADCSRSHYMRYPRFFGVCKFYITERCLHGDLCQFMHEEFPCRFYHLDLNHPKNLDANNCRFRHGGPLSEQLNRYFRKEIRHWVVKMCKDKPEQVDNMLKDYLDKFAEKQDRLQMEYGVQINDSATIMMSSDDGSRHDTSLSSKQILEAKGITTIGQINKIPIDDLLEYGLIMDQILEITTSQSGDLELVDSIDAIDEPMLDEMSTSSSDSVMYGFSEYEMNEAEANIRIKRSILQPINVDFSVSNNDHQTEEPNISETNAICQEQNHHSDSDDSDSEHLIISEEL
ncbi:uncharacterized protein LOC116343194 [Contarinia nasturtii]|uniref:uncharacterized protein LOC116343194 n=1 Tax=Contarinia nasturtii TaxID=265458 RepID=UPI0012D3CB92|nr:uncharacterized protein LOC116343194 [Contarinia nasturtii]